MNEIRTAPRLCAASVLAMASLRGRSPANEGCHDDRRQVAEHGMSRAGRADSGLSQPPLDGMITTSGSLWSRW